MNPAGPEAQESSSNAVGPTESAAGAGAAGEAAATVGQSLKLCPGRPVLPGKARCHQPAQHQPEEGRCQLEP